MKQPLVYLAGLALAILAGCIPLSLNAFYAEKDVSFDPALVGSWGDADNEAKIRFEKAAGNSYWMTDLEEDTTLKYDIHLFTLGKARFLDIIPSSTGSGKDGVFESHLIRGHSLLRVDRIDSAFVTAGLNEKWLKELLSKDTSALPHVTSDDQIVLTATTGQLQAFILKHLADTSAFESPEEIVRVGEK